MYKMNQYGVIIDNVVGCPTTNGTIKHVTAKDDDLWFVWTPSK